MPKSPCDCRKRREITGMNRGVRKDDKRVRERTYGGKDLKREGHSTKRTTSNESPEAVWSLSLPEKS